MHSGATAYSGSCNNGKIDTVSCSASGVRPALTLGASFFQPSPVLDHPFNRFVRDNSRPPCFHSDTSRFLEGQGFPAHH